MGNALALATLVVRGPHHAHAGSAQTLRASDVERWAENPCPLAAALGPLINARGTTHVEVSPKTVAISVEGGDADALVFSVRPGEDLAAMRDTVLGTCARAPGVAGVNNLQIDLRKAFDAADLGARRAAVEKAVNDLRAQKGVLVRVIPEQEAVCATPLPALPVVVASLNTMTIPDMQAYLKALAEADAVISRAGEACRAVDRLRPLAPDLVTSSSDARRGVREAASVSAGRLTEARVTVGAALGAKIIEVGYGIPNQPRGMWSLVYTETNKAYAKFIDECANGPRVCDSTLEQKLCDTGVGTSAPPYNASTSTLTTHFLPYVGGEPWCASPAGAPICGAAQESWRQTYFATSRDGCRAALTEGDGPAKVRRAKERYDAQLAATWQQLANMWGGSGSSSVGPEKSCHNVVTCVCRDDGRTTPAIGQSCPSSGDYGCSVWHHYDNEECE